MSIVSDQHPEEIKLIDGKFSDKVGHLGFSDLGKGFSFYPLGEIVDGHKQELSLARCWWKKT